MFYHISLENDLSEFINIMGHINKSRKHSYWFYSNLRMSINFVEYVRLCLTYSTRRILKSLSSLLV